jgi:hypothetical protein
MAVLRIKGFMGTYRIITGIPLFTVYGTIGADILTSAKWAF